VSVGPELWPMKLAAHTAYAAKRTTSRADSGDAGFGESGDTARGRF
jgi:hypothetical protein